LKKKEQKIKIKEIKIMMTKRQFKQWFTQGEKFRQTLLKIENDFNIGEIFETPFGKFYEQYMDLPKFSEPAEDLILEFMWGTKKPIHWYFPTEERKLIIKTIDDLYYAVMELSCVGFMKERINYLIPNVDFLGATLWFPGQLSEFIYENRITEEVAKEITTRLNRYIRTRYPEVDMVVHYDNEEFILWNNKHDEDE
jgi:hypothetical protein